jgi:predicted nucleic acid-binding protein
VALIVLDASVVVKVLLPDAADEADVDRAFALWSRLRAGIDTAIQPPHWLAEVGAVLARLSPGTAEGDVALLHAMDLPVLATGEVFLDATRLAVELDHHVFDTLYHAVALRSGTATLVTADERYFRKAARRGRIARLADHGS